MNISSVFYIVEDPNKIIDQLFFTVTRFEFIIFNYEPKLSLDFSLRNKIVGKKPA
jgi:hypothetical protein